MSAAGGVPERIPAPPASGASSRGQLDQAAGAATGEWNLFQSMAHWKRPIWLPWSSLSLGERSEWITIGIVLLVLWWWIG